MHYVVQSLANEVPALFLPSAILGTFARKAPCSCAWYRGQGFRLFAFPANNERRQLWNTTVNR